MAGASRNHNHLAGDFYRFLGNTLINHPCEPFISDMRLHIERRDHYVYPDVMVVCDEKAHIDTDMVNDATVLVEVLSPSTERYDRGRKFLHYQSLPSLQAYLLISQDLPLVEIFQRKAFGHWDYQRLENPDDRVILDVIGSSCSLPDLYHGLNFYK